MKRLISIAVASALVVGSTGSAMAHKAKKRHKHHKPAYAQVQRPYAYPQQHYRRSNDNGAALAFGMLAIGTIAAIAASKNGHAAPAYGYGQAYPPQPYPAYGAPVGYGYAPPPVVERERERVVEYRREYERERYVGY